MGHTPETRARALEVMRERREEWLKANGPCKCGSWKELETHHRDPSTKVDHKVWSWSSERREAELAKCEPRCKACHTKHHAEERKRHGLKRYKRGCRCDVCRKAKSVENAKRERGIATVPRASNPQTQTLV